MVGGMRGERRRCFNLNSRDLCPGPCVLVTLPILAWDCFRSIAASEVPESSRKPRGTARLLPAPCIARLRWNFALPPIFNAATCWGRHTHTSPLCKSQPAASASPLTGVLGRGSDGNLPSQDFGIRVMFIYALVLIREDAQGPLVPNNRFQFSVSPEDFTQYCRALPASALTLNCQEHTRCHCTEACSFLCTKTGQKRGAEKESGTNSQMARRVLRTIGS